MDITMTLKCNTRTRMTFGAQYSRLSPQIMGIESFTPNLLEKPWQWSNQNLSAAQTQEWFFSTRLWLVSSNNNALFCHEWSSSSLDVSEAHLLQMSSPVIRRDCCSLEQTEENMQRNKISFIYGQQSHFNGSSGFHFGLRAEIEAQDKTFGC